VFLTPPEHLLSSFHTILMVEFGDHLPNLPSFCPPSLPDPVDPRWGDPVAAVEGSLPEAFDRKVRKPPRRPRS
jgi:hypothetical protein